MSFSSSLPCCYCAGPLPSDSEGDCVDACSRACAHKYALLALEGKVTRPERSPSPNWPPSSFSPDLSDEELPELPEGFPESAHVSLDSETEYRDSQVSAVARPSATEPLYIEEYPFDERLTRPTTPTPESVNQQERARDTRLIRFMFNATDRRVEKVPEVQVHSNDQTSSSNGSMSTLRRIVSGVNLKRSRSDTRPTPPAHIQAKSRLAHEQ